MPLDDPPLHGIDQPLLVPVMLGEQQLQAAHRRPGRQRDRLHALAGQVAGQPPTVGGDVLAHRPFTQVPPKVPQAAPPRRPQPRNLLLRHP